ncbi:MAG: hypothetical protein ABIG89_07345 [Candidatus Woesearchaeota archaeon]
MTEYIAKTDDAKQTNGIIQDIDIIDISNSLQYLEGTQLEGLTLEELLQNIEDNNIWNEDRDEVKDIIDYTSRLYYAVVELRKNLANGKVPNLAELDRKYGITKKITGKYKQSSSYISRYLKHYLRSFFPKTEEERKDFAYLLGVLSRNRKGRKKTDVKSEQNKKVEKTIEDPEVMNRVIGILENITESGIKSSDRIRIHNEHLSRTLMYILNQESCELFNEYVCTDDEHAEYIRGLFDVEKLTLNKRDNGWHYYIMQIPNTIVARKVLMSFIELDMYPHYYREKDRITIEGAANFRVLYEKGFVKDAKQKRELKKIVDDIKYSEMEIFYRVRHEVKRLIEIKTRKMFGRNDWKEMAKRYPVTATTLRSWSEDLFDNDDEKPEKDTQKPHVIKNYRKNLAFINEADGIDIPDVYESDVPLMRRRKLFVPVFDADGMKRAYCFTHQAVQKYLRSYFGKRDGLSAEDMAFLQKELVYNLSLADERTLDMKIDGNKVTGIRSIHLLDVFYGRQKWYQMTLWQAKELKIFGNEEWIKLTTKNLLVVAAAFGRTVSVFYIAESAYKKHINQKGVNRKYSDVSFKYTVRPVIKNRLNR